MARKAHKRKKTEESPLSWGEMIGGTLAYAQDTVDAMVNWGFEKLQEGAEKPRKKKTGRHPAVDTAEDAARAAAGFIGEVGASFYATYDALKEERRKKRRSSKRPKSR